VSWNNVIEKKPVGLVGDDRLLRGKEIAWDGN
jgi:hypothetical protein